MESGNAKEILFNIPITVVRPKSVAAGETVSASNQFTPGEIKRSFYEVPRNATTCNVTISCEEGPGRYMFHAVQECEKVVVRFVVQPRRHDRSAAIVAPLIYARVGSRAWRGP